MSTDTSTGGANPESISTKPMVVQLYKTPDCSGEPTDAMTINQLGMPLDTEFTIDKRGQGERNYTCCMKMENADVRGTYKLDSEEETIHIQNADEFSFMKDNDNDNVVSFGSFGNHAKCARDVHIKVSPYK